MLKRSFSERGHSAHVKAFGVKVLPSTFQMPPLRVTGIDVKNQPPGDSTDSETTWNGFPPNHYTESNGTANNAQRGNGTCGGKPTDRSRYINSHSFDDLDLEELTESERDLKIDYELGRAECNIKMAYEVTEAERLAEEQERKLDEVMGLEDILRMCTDYEQQLQRERQSLTETRNTASRSCSMTKIKTNGSLTSPVHIRRFAELSKQRHGNCQVPILLLPPRTDWNMDTDPSQLDHSPSLEPPLPLSPDVLVELNEDWTNGVDQLSSTSSSEFLDKTLSPTTRYQSLYENDDVFTAFQTDPSDCMNGDDALLEESPFHFPIHQPSLSQHFQSGSPQEEDVDLRTMQLLPVVRTSCASNDGISDWERNYENQKLNLELTRLRKMKNESSERLGRTKNRVNEIDRLHEKVIQELEDEVELVLTDSEEEVLASLRLEAERMEVIREQQMELLMEAANEREEFQQQIETERRKLEALEAVHRDSTKRLESSSSMEIHHLHLLQAVRKDKEAVDTQLRLFDDLEFSLLELETRREEEREPMQRKLAAELDSLLQLKSQREDTLCLIEKQKSDVLHAAHSDVANLEKERYELMRAFKKERLIYLSIVDQLRRLSAQFSTSNNEFPTGNGNGYGLENGCGLEDLFPLSPSSTVADDLCRTPPMTLRIHQIIRNLEEEHQPMRSPPPPQTVGVSSRGIDCEGSQEVNGDVSPTSKVFSSGSEDSSFNSSSEGGGVGGGGMGKEDATRTEAGRKTDDDHLKSLTSKEEKLFSREEKLFGLGNNSQGGGGRGLARSLSEPRKTGRLELIPMDVGARTDDEIRLRDNYQRTQARPLTRYLPVRDKTLDLRCFVESSGHSIDDTSQVLVSASTCCGYLKKQGGKFRTWHKRWFVFDRSKRCLTYYIDRTETKLRRSIYFQSIMDVFVDHLRTVVSPNQRLTFCLKTLDRRYYLIAPTAEAMRIWIDVLFTGAEGYQEFC